MVTQNIYKVTFINKVSRLVNYCFFFSSLDILTFYTFFEYVPTVFYTRFKGTKITKLNIVLLNKYKITDVKWNVIQSFKTL